MLSFSWETSNQETCPMCLLDYDSISWGILMLMFGEGSLKKKNKQKCTSNQNKMTISKLFYLIFFFESPWLRDNLG